MNERLKELRQLLSLSQESFGDMIGVTRSAISYLESGRNKLTEQTIKSICLFFNVNENWLRTGEGEIFVTLSAGMELAKYAGTVLGKSNLEQEKMALLALTLIVDEWDLVKEIADKIKLIASQIENRPEESENMPKD